MLTHSIVERESRTTEGQENRTSGLFSLSIEMREEMKRRYEQFGEELRWRDETLAAENKMREENLAVMLQQRDDE